MIFTACPRFIEENMMKRFFAYFSEFPTHHFPDGIAARLKNV